jgi:hypothetical protein
MAEPSGADGGGCAFWYGDATMTTVNSRSVKGRLIESKRAEVGRILERRPLKAAAVYSGKKLKRNAK